MSSEFEIHSPLPVPDALARLRASVGGDIPVVVLPTSHPDRLLRGWVGERDFAVRLRTTYGNSFAAVCRGDIEPESSGSVVRGHVGMPFATGFVLFVWTLGVLSFAGRAIASRDLRGALMAGGMLAFGVGLVAFGRFMARKEAQGITDLLSEIIQAKANEPAA